MRLQDALGGYIGKNQKSAFAMIITFALFLLFSSSLFPQFPPLPSRYHSVTIPITTSLLFYTFPEWCKVFSPALRCPASRILIPFRSFQSVHHSIDCQVLSGGAPSFIFRERSEQEFLVPISSLDLADLSASNILLLSRLIVGYPRPFCLSSENSIFWAIHQ